MYTNGEQGLVTSPKVFDPTKTTTKAQLQNVFWRSGDALGTYMICRYLEMVGIFTRRGGCYEKRGF